MSMGFLVRFRDGPLAGETRVTPPEAGWPLPDFFSLALIGKDAEGTNFLLGEYVKIGESQLTEDFEGIMRGAEYEWHLIN
jgi:hypothetical protein